MKKQHDRQQRLIYYYKQIMKSYTEFGTDVAKDPHKSSSISPGNQDTVLNQIKTKPELIKTDRWKIAAGKIPDCLEKDNNGKKNMILCRYRIYVIGCLKKKY